MAYYLHGKDKDAKVRRGDRGVRPVSGRTMFQIRSGLTPKPVLLNPVMHATLQMKVNSH